MSGTGRRDQLSRLLQMLFAMRSGHPNASDLGELCEVSLRTVYRDLATLEMAGVPIQYRPDLQGYQIASAFSMPVPNLSRKEAIALMAATRLMDEEGGLLQQEGWTALGKILSCLPASERKAVEEIGRFFVSAPPGGEDLSKGVSAIVSATLIEGLSLGRRVRTWFDGGCVDDQTPGSHAEELALYRLVRMCHEWHLLGRIEAPPGPIVTMGLGEIVRAELTEGPYQMPSDEEVNRFLGMAGLGLPVPPGGEFVRLRVAAARVAELGESVWHPIPRFPDHPPGWREVSLVTKRIDAFLRLLIGMGRDAELLAPPRILDRLRVLRAGSAGETKSRQAGRRRDVVDLPRWRPVDGPERGI